MSDSERHLFAVACTGMAVFGMILALPGTVVGLPDFADRFELTLKDRGVFIAALFGGLLIGSLASGFVVDRAGFRRAIAGSAGAIAALLPVFTLAPSYRVSVGALFGLGLASATLNTAANALSSDLFPHERGRRMTILAIAFSVGGLLLPTATAAAAHLLSWRTIVLGGAAVSALITVSALIIATPPAGAGRVTSSLRAMFGQPGFGWFCLLVACAAANEGAFAGWTSTYLTMSGFDAVAATWGLSSHWFGLLAGRLAFAGRVDHAKRSAIIRAALAGAAILGAMLAVPIPWVLWIGPFAAGVSIGVIVPTALALAGERIPATPGALFGALLTMAQVGGILLPLSIGATADLASLRGALLIAVVNGGVVAALAWRVR